MRKKMPLDQRIAGLSAAITRLLEIGGVAEDQIAVLQRWLETMKAEAAGSR